MPLSKCLFSVGSVIIFCMLVSRSPALDSNTDGEEYDGTFLADECNCGPHTTKCVMQNDTKVCECDYKYRQVGEICTAYCEKEYQCNNDAPCVNESCQCLPGTSGDFCDVVDECEGIKGPIMCGDPQTVLCRYNVKTKKPYCMCRTFDYEYYAKNRTCIECDCGKDGSCTLVDGKKTCKCNEDAALRQVSFFYEIVERCSVCGCGNDSYGCSFDGLYTKICHCKNGTSQYPDLYGDVCRECNCGPNGQCYYKGWYRYCNCDQGYKPFLTINNTDLYCKECDCGKNGVCSFKEEVKQCKCNPGYALRDGICTACQCYADNKTVNCTFNNKIQSCLCPDGYETGKFFCKDIDECMNGNNSCPPTTDCFNTMGSYECKCKEGYVPKSAGDDPKTKGCTDIDECEDESLCPSNNTICTNFPGTYSCECVRGFVPVPPNISPKTAGCVKEVKKKESGSSGWTIALIVLGIAIVAFVIILIFVRRRSANRRNLRMNTPF